MKRRSAAAPAYSAGRPSRARPSSSAGRAPTQNGAPDDHRRWSIVLQNRVGAIFRAKRVFAPKKSNLDSRHPKRRGHQNTNCIAKRRFGQYRTAWRWGDACCTSGRPKKRVNYQAHIRAMPQATKASHSGRLALQARDHSRRSEAPSLHLVGGGGRRLAKALGHVVARPADEVADQHRLGGRRVDVLVGLAPGNSGAKTRRGGRGGGQPAALPPPLAQRCPAAAAHRNMAVASVPACSSRVSRPPGCRSRKSVTS